jgi:pimeloyl-ACP methyl ester carboxylesterase
MFAFTALCSSLEYRGAERPTLTRDWIPQNFTQYINHFNLAEGTFTQRYYEVNLSEVLPLKYVILSIAGESDSFNPSGDGNFVGVLAADLNATVFTIEHRYFGGSYPTIASTYNYSKYLNVPQVLEDLAYFATEKKKEPKFNNTKWLVIGGSYSGLLSSYAREVHPEVFHAALSSSGVVLATDNYADFDLQIGVAMGQECAAVARSVRLQIENFFARGEEKWVLERFGMADLPDPDDFNFILGDIFTIGPQYSARGKLCDPLVDTLKTGGDAFEALAKYSREVFIPQYCDGNATATYSRTAMRNTENQASGAGPRSWQWMTCNEVAYWQVSPGRLSVRTKNLTQKWYADQCADIFGTNHSRPDTKEFNERYHGLAQNQTRVFYSTGSQDPWTWTCITEDSGVPKGCAAHTIIGDEMGHCNDLRAAKDTDAPDLIKTRLLERALIAQWMREDP